MWQTNDNADGLPLKRTGKLASIELTASLPIHLTVTLASELTSASMEIAATSFMDKDTG